MVDSGLTGRWSLDHSLEEALRLSVLVMQTFDLYPVGESIARPISLVCPADAYTWFSD